MAAIWVCILIATMDLSAGLLAMLAQAYEDKNEVVASYLLRCKEPVFKACQLSTAAAALLVVAQAVPFILGGCFSQSNSFWAKINRILALFSGICFIGVLAMLSHGAMFHAKTEASCGFIFHLDVLGIAGWGCFVHAATTIAYYVTATAAAHLE